MVWTATAYIGKCGSVNLFFFNWTSGSYIQSQKGCFIRFRKNYRAKKINSEKQKGFLEEPEKSFSNRLAPTVFEKQGINVK